MSLSSRAINLFIAVDQLVWVVCTAGNGKPDETISAAAYRMEMQRKVAGRFLRPVIDFIFSWAGPGHCKEAYEDELFKRQLPMEYRYEVAQAAAAKDSSLGQG